MFPADAIITPVGQLPGWSKTEYPACIDWLRFDELSGTAVADRIGNIASIATVNTPVFGADGLALVAASSQYAETLMSNMTSFPLAVGKTIISEFDFTHQAGTTQCIFEFGDAYNSTNSVALGAWSVNLQNSIIRCQLKNSSWSTVSGWSSPAITSAFTAGTRYHCVVVLDLATYAATNIPAIHIYINGQLMGSGTSTVIPGGGNMSTGSYVPLSTRKFTIGRRANNGTPGWYFNGTLWDMRHWIVNGGLPSNMNAIAYQMYTQRDIFPSLMRGII